MDYFNNFFPDLLKFLYSIASIGSNLLTGGIVIALLFLYGLFVKPISRKVWAGVVCLLLFFAFFNAWREERKKTRDVELQLQNAQNKLNDLTVPNLHGEITSVYRAPAGSQNQNTLLTLIIDISNTGATSVVKINGVEVIHGSRSYPVKNVLCPNGPIGLGSNSGHVVQFPPSDCLPIKGMASPTINGGNVGGFWQLVVEDITPEELGKPGTIIRLYFQDVNKKTYIVDGPPIGGPESEWPLSPREVQQPLKHQRK